jgi:hypothetical protein
MATIPNTLAATTATDVSLSPLARLAGPLALAAGSLFTVVKLLLFAILDHSDRMATMAHPLFVPSAIANFVAYCLLLLALVAVYEWQARRAGVLGLIGFVAALIGTLFMAGDMWFEAFAIPWLGDVAFEVFAKKSGTLIIGAASTFLLFTIGWVLFGLASLRARAFPPAIAVAILVGGAIIPWRSAPYGALLGLAFMALGVWMLRRSASLNQLEANVH